MATIPPTAADSFLAGLTQPRKAAPETPQDRFLTLLVTQMRNQDPMNPLENAEVTSQLAQISTVTGIDKLNAAVNGMATSLLAAQSVQAGSLIGHGVLGPGSSLLLAGERADGGITLGAEADRIKVSVLTPAGELVRTIELGAAPAGTLTFQWDGSTDAGGVAAPGFYAFKVEALAQGKAVDAQSLGYGRVQSVVLGDQQLVLDTLGLGPLPLDQVKQILQ
jgi:flagellar basal-body rod modification protein FlgD